MDDLSALKDQVLHYARGIWKHRWIAVALSWFVFVAGILAVDVLKDRYSAETKVYIDSTSVLKPLLKGLAIEPDFTAVVQLMVRQLLSRPNLERAVRNMDMDLEVNTRAEMEKLIIRVRERVEISAKQKSGIYTISYTDTDQNRARQMVQTLLDIFVEDALGKTGSESDKAIEFLNKQIEKYDTLLREAETRREEFKRKNIGMMPSDGNTYYAQLQELEVSIEEAELMLAELVNRRDQISRQIGEFQAIESEPEVAVKSSLDIRIEEQEKRLDDLLLIYTEQHPDVINAERVLDRLRDRKKSEAIQLKNGSSSLDNPVYQELQILLSRTKADISSIRARVNSLNAKKSELKERIDIVPRIEAELQRLNRDYEIHRKNYNEFVSRRERALISEDVESGTEQVKFRVIEPPYVSALPVYPNRALFDLGVLFFALVVGYGFGLLISMLKPVFYNQKDLMAHIGGSVLGAVNKFDTPYVLSKRRKNLIFFCIVNLVFFTTAGALIYVHSQGILILSQLQSIVAN